MRLVIRRGPHSSTRPYFTIYDSRGAVASGSVRLGSIAHLIAMFMAIRSSDIGSSA